MFASFAQLASKEQCGPLPNGLLMLTGKLALALEDKEEQQAKGPDVMLRVRMVVARLVQLLRYFWSFNTSIYPVRRALQVRGCTPAEGSRC